MNKRILFGLLIAAALLALGAVFWFVLKPVLPGFPSQQPPALPASVPFDPSKSAPTPPAPTTGVKPDANSPAERERQAQEALKRQGMDYAARQGSYSNADDYQAIRDAEAGVTAELIAKLEARRTQLRKDHPAFGASYSQTIRSLSTDLDASSIPVLNGTNAKVVVQAQQITEEEGKPRAVTTVLLTLSFVKSGDSWIPSDVSLQPYNP